MNILEKLPFLSSKTAPSEGETPELTPEGQKAERIRFHRDHVRNGPLTFRHTTAAGLRRLRQRDLDRSQRRARRAQLKNYHATQRLASFVRGQLQLAGILEYVVPRELDPIAQVRAVIWLAKRFGTESDDGMISLRADDVYDALRAALKFYGQAVGQPGLEIPEGYVLPVYERDDDDVELPNVVAATRS